MLRMLYETGKNTVPLSRDISCDQDRLADIRSFTTELGLTWFDTINPHRLLANDEQLRLLLCGKSSHLPVRYLHDDDKVYFLLSTAAIRLDRLQASLRRHSRLAPRVRIVDERILRAALIERGRPMLLRTAINGLSDRHPEMSAHIVANAWQGYAVGVLIALLPVAIMAKPLQTLTMIHMVATLFFLACVVLRIVAALSTSPEKYEAPPPALTDDTPVYSVLVALYKEANIVPDLLAALDRIIWPRDRLEIKLVCEADDPETLAAIRASALPAHIEIIEVPPIGPRTKPKALSYALPLTSGDLIVLYDAEDWPHPLQLVQAWEKFRISSPKLAVLQAPLEISNGHESAVARMFAFEYRALFRGLLPFLARMGLLLPLGGTSNHFRREALEAVSGWDPFNVTEDADLGIRLARFGYHMDVLSLPTWEKAPRKFNIWLRQRTRWLKGWAQTWLVHMRHPLLLARDLGGFSYLVAQVLFAGMLASILLHPVLLLTFFILILRLQLGMTNENPFPVLIALDLINVALGYFAFLLLGWRTLYAPQKRGFWKIVILTPAYWVMMSLAGWRAIWQLWRQPFKWEKTPHEAMNAPPGKSSVFSNPTASCHEPFIQ